MGKDIDSYTKSTISQDELIIKEFLARPQKRTMTGDHIPFEVRLAFERVQKAQLLKEKELANPSTVSSPKDKPKE